MCLAVPTRVIAIVDEDTAVVDLEGVRKEICTTLLEELDVGDYVVLHVGYALSRLDPREAENTLRLFRELDAPPRPETIS